MVPAVLSTGTFRLLLLTALLTLSAPFALPGVAHADDEVPEQQVEVEQECTEYPLEDLRRALRDASTVTGGTATIAGVPDDACPFPIHFSSYELPGGSFLPYEDQTLSDNVSVVLSGGQEQAPLVVTVPGCAFQTDLYLGDNVLGDEEGEQAAPHDGRNPDVDQKILVGSDVVEVGDDSCTATLVLSSCLVAGEGSDLDSTGVATNPHTFPIDVTFGGTTVLAVDGVDTEGDDVTVVTLQPGDTTLLFSNGTAGDIISMSFNDTVVQTEITDDCAPGVEVDKTNDADGDAAFTDDETAPATGEAVDFTVLVTNTGELAGTVTLTDAFGDTTLTVFGADATLDTVCTLGDETFSSDTLLQPGAAITCTFTLDEYSPAAGEALVNTVTAVLTTRKGDVDDEDLSTVRSPAPEPLPVPAVAVDKTNDADTDGTFTDSEFASGPGEDVDFTVVVTNTGEQAGQVRLFDTLDDGSELFLFGLDPADTTDVTTTCLAADDAAFGATDLLAVGDSITCTFILAGYSPAAGVELVNDVTAELVTYTFDGEAVSGVDVLADDVDPSTVASNDVLGTVLEQDQEPTEAPEPEPAPAPADDTEVLGAVESAADEAVLPEAGLDSWVLLLLALGLLGAGAVLLDPRVARRLA